MDNTLQFEFKVRSAVDGKSNILCITSIRTRGGQTYSIPDEYQPANLHTAVITTEEYSKIKNTLRKRHQLRKIWIEITKEINETYFDKSGNMQFKDYYLEETTEETNTETASSSASEQSLVRMLEKLLEDNKQRSENQNIKRIIDEFTIEKFNGKNVNAHQWINRFEEECERFSVTQDRKKIEILKFFLEKTCEDWYSCMLLKFTIESEWENWKKNFCETFANKGWTPIRYALAFKYQTGSLLDYALKKEKLLLEIRKSIDTGTIIDLITFGLPNFVADRIDREVLKGTEDLYNEIGKLEHLVYNKNFEIKKNKSYNNKGKPEKTPCNICREKGKGIRFHPETDCWFKLKEDKIKNVNNSVLEMELNSKDPKN